MSFPRWEPATQCTGGPTPGAKALMSAALDAFGGDGATNLGIYNCRTIRGGSTTSCHGEGRACDIGFPMRNGRGNPAGQRLVDSLLPFVGRLGLQAIIFDRRIYSAKSPTGRKYTGVAPHYDHVHIELTRTAAETLSRSTVTQVLNGHGVPAVRQPNQPIVLPGAAQPAGRTSLQRGSAGRDVELVQRFLGVRVDGVFGPKTEAAVKRYQQMRGLTPDGVVGPATWAPILGVLQAA